MTSDFSLLLDTQNPIRNIVMAAIKLKLDNSHNKTSHETNLENLFTSIEKLPEAYRLACETEIHYSGNDVPLYYEVVQKKTNTVIGVTKNPKAILEFEDDVLFFPIRKALYHSYTKNPWKNPISQKYSELNQTTLNISPKTQTPPKKQKVYERFFK